MRAAPLAILILLAVLVTAPKAQAELGVIDYVPAATLLVPYFEVDVSDAACADPTAGATTLFAVTNTVTDSTIARVTLWTDWNVPFLVFDIFLTGFDVQTINLRDIFCLGRLPQTGLGSGNSPVGSGSSGFPTFAEQCNQTNTPGAAPFYEPLPAFFIDDLKAAFTGQALPLSGRCAGSGQRGRDIAVGYITIDTTQDCPVFGDTPDFPGYFSDIATEDNILLGDFFLADPSNNFSQGFPAIHLEAGFQGPNTFYGQYTIPNAGAPIDRREPLPSTFAARFARAAGFNQTRHLIWRETGMPGTLVECGDRPAFFPLGTILFAVGVFDEQENFLQPSVLTLPNAVNALTVNNIGGGDVVPKLDVADLPFGWIIYDLRTDALYDDPAQGYVISTFQALGLFSVGLHGAILDDQLLQ